MLIEFAYRFNFHSIECNKRYKRGVENTTKILG